MDTGVEAIRTQLRRAVDECSARGLAAAAKWAAEQLCSLPAASTSSPSPAAEERSDQAAQQDQAERDRVALAKCLFDLREFERAAFALEECSGPRATFLRLYSRYLNRERQAQANGNGSGADEGQADQTEHGLLAIRDELLDVSEPDSFCLYLLGLVQEQLGQREAARESCLRSVRAFEFNWSCWQLLATLLDTRQPSDSLGTELPATWMRHAFLAQVLVEQFTATSEADFQAHVRTLELLFTEQNQFLLGLRAVRHYNVREYSEARQAFRALQQLDPFRLDLSDTYSNILYVMEDRAQLSMLAHRCAALDRFRPETCVVIGNYYGLRREHEKAVAYFQRALQLDSKYLAAWTLMGHEFIEMKNTHAAADAYQHALRVDQRDYRAWHGLGNTYEMLNMYHYATEYHMRAASLRPYDSRMWFSLGTCYEKVDRRPQAIESYRRALLGSAEMEAMAITRLAHIHEQEGSRKRAAYYYQLLVEHAIKNGGVSDPLGISGGQPQDELARACIFLAAFETDRSNPQAAQKYLAQVVDAAGISPQKVEEAKAMMRAVTSTA
ncbi:anaphase-promoting complex component apc8 [Coemansia sp. RSA 552]|nr:anaphase-promoting complex component apc8 [Coemansia sp. RSA 552]